MSVTVETQHKCIVNGRRLSLCGPLEAALSYGNPTPKGKGLYKPERVILATGEPGTEIIQLHSGEFVGKGVALNFCPFCGEEIKTWKAPDSAVKVSEIEN